MAEFLCVFSHRGKRHYFAHCVVRVELAEIIAVKSSSREFNQSKNDYQQSEGKNWLD